MAIEKTLPENLDKAAIDWSMYYRHINDALWHIQAARDCYIVCQPRMMAPDKAIVHALRMLEYAFEATSAQVGRIVDSAERIADEANEKKAG